MAATSTTLDTANRLSRSATLFPYNDAVYQTTGTDVKVTENLQVAYIEGSGDDVPASLENLGIHVHFLGREDLATGDLQKYDVILVGVRGYAVRRTCDLQPANT